MWRGSFCVERGVCSCMLMCGVRLWCDMCCEMCECILHIPVCSFKTPPCVPSKCFKHAGALDGTHGGILNAHTRTRTKTTRHHTIPHPAHHHSTHTHTHTHTHITPQFRGCNRTICAQRIDLPCGPGCLNLALSPCIARTSR